MTEQEYRQHPAISRSDLWKLRDSPQKFRYAKDHPEAPTPALLFGQVFHKLALEPDTFDSEFAVAPQLNLRTKAGKEAMEAFQAENQGKTIVTNDMYEQAKAMCASLMAEPLAVKLLTGRKEVSFFWTDEETGEECKCRADCLNESLYQPVVIDLKSTDDASTAAFMRHAVNYGYDFQAAMYSEGVERNIGQKPLFIFIAVEKKPPYAVNILQADDKFIRRGYTIYRDLLGTYHKCKETGDWYGYLGEKHLINDLALPAWAAKEME